MKPQKTRLPRLFLKAGVYLMFVAGVLMLLATGVMLTKFDKDSQRGFTPTHFGG